MPDKTAEGKDLRVGDVIDVWWEPYQATIVNLGPYDGPLDNICTVAEFADGISMLIEAEGTYTVFNRV